MNHTSVPPKNIACIGGGTGTFVVLKGLKSYGHHLTAIVSMSDSGGSNRRIRDEFGLLPTSDLRQCIVALSDENGGAGVLRKLFMYRFEKGNGISGMTFGNLFMAALTDILGSQEEAIRQTGKVLRIRGSVIPVSFTDTNLVATYEDGTKLYEEHEIDEPPHHGSLKIADIELSPPALPNPEAINAVSQADLVVLGPGDLYTSVIPNLLVGGLAEAIAKSNAKVAYIMNLMTKSGQTYDFTARQHLDVLNRYLPGRITHVLINTGKIPPKVIDIYAQGGEKPVIDDLDGYPGISVVRCDMVSRYLVDKTATDSLVRSLIRHDSKKVADVLVSILNA